MIAGVCLLVVLTIAECRFDFSVTASPKQVDDCGDVNDTSSKLGQCIEAIDDYDYDDFCDAGCVAVVEQYFECLGIADYYDYIFDELEETCDVATDSTTPTVETDSTTPTVETDSITPTVETDDAVTVCAISTVTAILVAIAAALN